MGYEDARLQSELLLAGTLGISRAMVRARSGEQIPSGVVARFGALISRRARHEPLAYILGHQEFYGLDFIVDTRVLIPRHETELLVQLALERARQIESPIIVDVGTGSGALALTIARHLPSGIIYATDISPDALAVAQLNATRLGASDVRFVVSDLLQGLADRFDILTANLPYIPSDRYSDLPAEIREFEPRIALDGGQEGLELIQRLLAQTNRIATRDSVALLEISEEQGGSVLDLVHRELPTVQAELHQDLDGLDRVLEVRWNST